MLRLALVALALVALPAAASAATALELLQRASRALTQDGTLRYDAILTDAPDIRDADLVMRSQVLARFDETGALDAASVDSRVTRKSSAQRGRIALTVADGQAQVLDYIRKQEHRAKADELVSGSIEIQAGALPLYLPMFFSSGAGAILAADDSLTLDGPVRDGREECMVVTGDFKNSRLALYISTSDDLPRRLDIIQDGQTVTLRFSRLRTGVPATDRSFEIAQAPRGFTTARDSAEGENGPKKPAVAATDRPVGLEIGNQAPDWTLADENGRAHSLSDYRGEIVLMDFWATWCPPCRRAMPGLQRMHDELEGEGLNVIGINTRERSPDLAPGFMKSNRYTYELLLNGDAVADQYAVRGIPTFYVIGTEGEILFKGAGYSHAQEKEMEKIIRDALGLATTGGSLENLDEIDLDNLDR